MKTSLFGLCASLILMAFCLVGCDSQSTTVSEDTPTAIQYPNISSELPPDVNYPMATPPATPPSFEELQTQFDNWSWAMFVALNWPANAAGPMTETPIGTSPNSPRVWELWINPSDLFTPKDPNEVKFHQQERSADRKRLSHVINEGEFELNADLDEQAASALPLIDNLGNFAINEITISPDMSQFIKENKLNEFEVVRQKNEISIPNGSIEIKASWRLFPEDWNENRPEVKRYHVRRADVYVGADRLDPDAGGEPYTLENALVGLVGLHIIQKTENQPDWMWATFEQVDNYEISYKPDELPGLTPTFQPASGPESPANHVPKEAGTGEVPAHYYWNKDGQPTAKQYVASTVAVSPNEPALPSKVNEEWRNALIEADPNSVWQYYRLNTTQWFERLTDPRTGDYVNGLAHPRNEYDVSISRNSVLETYLIGSQTLAAQVPTVDPTNLNIDVTGEDPQTTLDDVFIQTRINFDETKAVNTWSSCVVCHGFAYYHVSENDSLGIADKVIPTDGSYLWFTFLKAP